ncbi:TIGR04063 family PEP-CTERM/XrtA system glycosyltransferase [Sediminicurvatus halobius]|uniref:Glycosyltransferase, exosortase A system-associated n=1 Tax=Sediminicurvatus halobius TaxID=2182432 RepID=A0A2U2N0B7_9GAMM|nr:TIGR04063 family PEP-CTERM/XrtA system glycosyltransferase [Spiribacter halobius]PWG62681.1 glycosyltransferase, exosortase A system-associated [Spiribacter halobius]UEX77350.1 glycosyltransferase, exosortase A system-associated [Spiribacter halobius]
MSRRILHVLDHSIPLHSGYSFRTRAILDEQRALGWETEHVTGPRHYGAEALEETVEGLRFHRTPELRGPGHSTPVLREAYLINALAARVAQVAKAVRPDVIHAHSPPLNGFAALRVARRLGLPLVYEVRAFWEDAAVDHGTTTEGSLRYRATRALESYVLRRADAVTCICEGLRGEIVGRGVDPARVTVIPNAVDPSRFRLAGERDAGLADELGLGEGPVLGFIGSFYGYEGLRVAVEAMVEIRARHPGARLLLVGGGPQEAALREQVRALGLEGAVVLTGRVPHEAVQRYYDLIDILVYPRLSMRLTDLVTPLKPLEAMAQGRLVLASDVGGHRELIRDGENGILFPAGDPEALAQRALELLDDRTAWPALHANGRRFVESERSWPASVARYEGVYDGLGTAAEARACS